MYLVLYLLCAPLAIVSLRGAVPLGADRVIVHYGSIFDAGGVDRVGWGT